MMKSENFSLTLMLIGNVIMKTSVRTVKRYLRAKTTILLSVNLAARLSLNFKVASTNMRIR